MSTDQLFNSVTDKIREFGFNRIRELRVLGRQ